MLRRPPLGHVLATAHDMAREHRIIAAVGTTDVPVPPALGLCTDDVGQRRAVLRDGLRRRRRARQRRARPAAAGRAAPCGQRAPHRRARRPPRRRHRRRRPRRPGQARGLRRAPGQALDDAVGELEDPRAAGDRRGRPPAARAHARAARRRDRPRRLPLRQLPDRPSAGRIAAVLDWELCTLGDPLADVGYLGVYWSDGTAERPGQRPDLGRGLPHLRRPARALRHAHRAATSAASATTSRSPPGGWR